MKIAIFYDDSGTPCGAVANGHHPQDLFVDAANTTLTEEGEGSSDPDWFRVDEVRYEHRRWEWWGGGEEKQHYCNSAKHGERGAFLATVIERLS